MYFRSTADLSECLRLQLDRFREYDLIVGLPRSGLFVGALLSLQLQKPLLDLESYLAGRPGMGGARLGDERITPSKVLLIDDSVTSGAAMSRARALLGSLAEKVTFACVYVVPGAEHLVDLYCEVIPHPRVFEWNVFHHCYGQDFCFDMDGVLCMDPTEEQNDDGEAYLDFIRTVPSMYIPQVKIGTIVTCRLEKYRVPTEEWLMRHGVRYKKLVMMPFSSPAERISYGHARFKAQNYASMSNTKLFIESSEGQAREIFKLTGLPVLSVEKMFLHRTPVQAPDKIPRRAVPKSVDTRERFLILSRGGGVGTERLRKILEPLGKVEVIVDQAATSERGNDKDSRGESYNIHLTDDEAAGFGGLMSSSGPFPEITAWSRALAHLAASLEPDEAVWFVEDDVAGDAESFTELVRKTAAVRVDLAATDIRSKREDGSWYYWNYAEGFFDDPWRAFLPLCRVSGRLLRAILDFQKQHGRFTFHEVLFASLARQAGMRCLSWSDEESFRHLFPGFRYRPEVREVSRGISHPVKDEDVHREICQIGASSQGNEWYHQELGKWKQLFSTDSPVKVLETGTGDGTGALFLLQEIFPHPFSEIHGVDDYDGETGRESLAQLQTAVEKGPHAKQLHLYEGGSCEVLAWMIAGDGFWESFDFIHLNSSGDAGTLLTEACQAWNLLKPGGMLVFGEKADPDDIMAFLSTFQRRLKRGSTGRRTMAVKNI